MTIVTGIWDIKREELTEGWSRTFQHYLNNFEKLLKTDNNMIIYIEEKYKSFVEERRKEHNTQIIVRELDWFKNNPEIYNKIQEIRTDPKWYNQVGWLSESTQAKLEMYNPLVMSKMFLLNDAAILDKFNSSHLVWLDGGITNTVHEGYFWKHNVISKLEKYLNKFTFVCFPYDGKQEIHGFEYKKLCEYAGAEVDKVARGGIFGGPKETIATINSLYYHFLNDSLSSGYMGTEESIFTIMTYKYPELIQYFEIENNGLLGYFFENLDKETLKAKHEGTYKFKENTSLYVLTFNSPKQFETLIKSMTLYDNDFLLKTNKYLLNNSTDRSTDEEYKKLCDEYGFVEIKKDNIGICGGRQFIAEHFDESNADNYLFFEDDMFFYVGNEEYCRNGFKRKINKLYKNLIEIINREGFDFIKLNFTEFFGDNSRQWAWFNVPQSVREEYFPNNLNREDVSDKNVPNTEFKNIKVIDGLPYATGDIFYCNWPQIVSREGNKKMFIDTKWSYPYEQTWMSHIFQLTKKNEIKPAILLATPTEHNRFEHYNAEDRREN